MPATALALIAAAFAILYWRERRAARKATQDAHRLENVLVGLNESLQHSLDDMAGLRARAAPPNLVPGLTAALHDSNHKISSLEALLAATSANLTTAIQKVVQLEREGKSQQTIADSARKAAEAKLAAALSGAARSANLTAAHQKLSKLEQEVQSRRKTAARDASEAAEAKLVAAATSADLAVALQRVANLEREAESQRRTIARGARTATETHQLAQAKLAATYTAEQDLKSCYQDSGTFAAYLTRIERLWSILNVTDETSKALRLEYGLAPELREMLGSLRLKGPAENGAYRELRRACLRVDPRRLGCQQCQALEGLVDTPFDGVFCVECVRDFYRVNPCANS